MSKPVIAVDFDDVLLDFNRGFLTSHNLLYGTKLTYDQLINYDNWEVVYGTDKDTMVERAKRFYHSPEHQRTLPVEGTLQAVADLAKDYSLQIVTSRPETVRDATLQWLDRHFPGLFSDFHFTNIYAAATGVQPKNKAEVCRSIGARTLIDDALRHAREVSSSGIPVLLPDRPWNRGETPPGVHRLQTWDDIVKWIRTNV
jgi:5'(3')-deoxyribonucleotidase